MMKLIQKLWSVALLVSPLFVGCDNETERNDKPVAAVTYYLMNGSWQLTELNGDALAEETYMYVEFNRTEHSFDIFTNIGSMYGRHTTGIFVIEQDEYENYILSGSYDNGVGDWNDSYRVEAAEGGEKMLWQGKTTNEYMAFERIESIPEI